MTLDGFSAGPDQDLQNPAGVGFMPAFGWQFATRSGHEMMGKEGGGTGVDDDFVKRGFEGIGAWILGRNMFGPVRGPWPDENWKGWWGDTPVYKVPVFVLTHHARKPIEMKGGTTFHFVTDGIHSALEQAMEAGEWARRMFSRAVGRARCGNICRPGWWTRCIRWCRRCCWGRASGFGMGWIW